MELTSKDLTKKKVKTREEWREEATFGNVDFLLDICLETEAGRCIVTMKGRYSRRIEPISEADRYEVETGHHQTLFDSETVQGLLKKFPFLWEEEEKRGAWWQYSGPYKEAIVGDDPIVAKLIFQKLTGSLEDNDQLMADLLNEVL